MKSLERAYVTLLERQGIALAQAELALDTKGKEHTTLDFLELPAFIKKELQVKTGQEYMQALAKVDRHKKALALLQKAYDIFTGKVQ